MNAKRTVFWSIFLVILALIVWGLVVAMNKAPATDTNLPRGTPAPVSATDHVRGPADAPVTVIEYSDFQCPACRNYYFVVKRLLEEASTTMRLVYRHFPLEQHPHAIHAAMISEAAGAQGKFWEMYDMIFSGYEDWVNLSIEDSDKIYAGYAEKIGLDMGRYSADIASTTLRAKVSADDDDGRKIGVNYTPTFFANGKAVENPSSYEAFKALITLPLAEAGTAILVFFLVVAILGFADASYLTIEHYRGVIPPCSVVEGCETVLTSQYSVILGVPTSLLGAIYYLAVAMGAFVYLESKHARGEILAHHSSILKWTLMVTALGFGISLWFVYLQLVILHSICVYCMFSAVTSTVLFVTAIAMLRKSSKAQPDDLYPYEQS